MIIEDYQLTAMRVEDGISMLPMPGGRVLWQVEAASSQHAGVQRWIGKMRADGHEVIIGTLDDLTTRALALLLDDMQARMLVLPSERHDHA